jgi:hypothetical protein
MTELLLLETIKGLKSGDISEEIANGLQVLIKLDLFSKEMKTLAIERIAEYQKIEKKRQIAALEKEKELKAEAEATKQ